MPADDRQQGEHDDMEIRPSAPDRHHQPADHADDPYRQVRRRLSDRARRGEDPFAGWLGPDPHDGDLAWWELPDEPPLLPDAPNWRPGTIVGHLVPAERRAAPRPQSAGLTSLTQRETAMWHDQLSLPDRSTSFDNDGSFRWNPQALFDDWADEQQRRPKKSKKSGKRPRRDDSPWDRSR